MEEFRSIISQNGRIVVPVSLRKILGLKAGDSVIFSVDEKGIHMNSQKHSLSMLRTLFKTHTKPGESLSQSLIDMRRREAKEE